LLKYLADYSVSNPDTPPKEYQVATEVLGRHQNFDPHIDPAVRIQVGRLRSKLAEYYIGEGVTDPVLISIPKGGYVVAFQWNHRERTEKQKPNGATRQFSFRVVIAVALFSALAGSLGVWLAFQPAPPPVSLSIFWRDFLVPGEAPLVVFSNPQFTGASHTGLRTFNPTADPPSQINDTYTGIGEAMAIRDLVNLFHVLRQPLRVKRSRLLTWDEDKYSNLIFLGSPVHNPEVLFLFEKLKFQHKALGMAPEPNRAGFMNQAPKSGEEKLYLTTPVRPYVDDYAIIALLPGHVSGRMAMVLAGCTTFGTYSAAEFVSRSERTEELLIKLTGQPRPVSVPPFEALLYTRIEKGEPVQTRLVAVHRHQ
jgi:hypothetical protein